MKEERPDPDKLLTAINHASAKRGQLKIFLGMAAGVGKTYAMLADAKELQKKGIGVVAGYIEPHGRPETKALIVGLDVLPPLKVEHRGITLEEFDLEAALKLSPEIILVDELAHTNAPGLRNSKRWEDVIELLNAGINVYSTLNIQHLESLNDVVASITHIEVRETIPDTVLARADTIELIDIPPEELITRLKEGKIYPEGKIHSALANFFREGNLLALREIALRKAAEKIDEQVLVYRQNKNIEEIWKTSEKVLVGIAPNPFARRLVRAAARIAASKHSELVVVCVETPRYQFLKEGERRLLEDAVLLAKKLGATIERRYGTDIVQEILNVATSKNVAVIVVGKPLQNRLREFFFGSIADSIVRQSGAIDVHLITGQVEEATTVPFVKPTHNPRFLSLCFTVAITAFTTMLCLLLHPYLQPTNLVMVYILASVVSAVLFGRTESIVSSILNVLAFDYFFVLPRFSFSVSDLQYFVTFATMLTTSLIISTLMLHIRLQSKIVAERERRTQALYDAQRGMIGSSDPLVIGKATVSSVRQLLGADSCFLHAAEGKLLASPASNSEFELQDKEHAVALFAYDKQKPVGIGTETLPGAGALYLPVATERACYGVVGIAVSGQFDRSLFPVLELLTQQAALCLERNKFQEDSFSSKLVAETQSIRSVLLSSISHDFRTPLTVIDGAASAILESSGQVPEKTKMLAESIKSQSERLTKMVTNVLSLTHLETSGIEPNRNWESIEELVSSALDKTESLIRHRKISINIPRSFPLIYVDAILFEQLLVNIFENSGHYGTGATLLEIEAHCDNKSIIVDISDDGPGFIFTDSSTSNEALVNGDTKRRIGSGLGLIICEAIARIHGGSFEAKNRLLGGARCTIRVPFKEPNKLTTHETQN